MSTTDLVALIVALAHWAWPLFAVLVLWLLRPAVLEILKSRAFEIRVGEMEVSVQNATDQHARRLDDLQRVVDELRDKVHPEAGEPPPPPPLARPILAWVDDVPENNAYEIKYLKDHGVRILQMT